MTDPTSPAAPFRLIELAAEGTPDVRPLPSGLKRTQMTVVVRRPSTFMPIDRAPGIPFLPVQARPVDRSTSARNSDGSPQLYATLWDRKFTEDGQEKIIRMSRFGPFGSDANDPSRPFSLAVPFSVAICPTLAPYAAAHCGLW
jgi:hypothetical protein